MILDVSDPGGAAPKAMQGIVCTPEKQDVFRLRKAKYMMRYGRNYTGMVIDRDLYLQSSTKSYTPLS